MGWIPSSEVGRLSAGTLADRALAAEAAARAGLAPLDILTYALSGALLELHVDTCCMWGCLLRTVGCEEVSG